MYSKITTIPIILIFLTIGYSYFKKKSSVNETTNLISRKVLFGNPDKMQIKISYDGRHISYIAPLNGVLNIWIAPRDNVKNAKPITHDKKRGIRNHLWAYDNKHILYSIDGYGDENYRIYSKNIHNGLEILLTPEKGVRAVVFKASYKFPDEIVIGTNERDSKFFDIYSYNISNGNRKLILQNSNFGDVIIDLDFNVRFASIVNDAGETEYYKYKKNSNWQPYMKIGLEDSANTSILGFDKTGMILYMRDSRGLNTAALKAIDLNSDETTILAKDDRSDVAMFIMHPTENTIQAVATNYEKITYKVIDKSLEEDFSYLNSISKDGEFYITKRSLDDKYWSVALIKDDAPIKFYIYDRESKKAEYLFSNHKAIEQYNLAKMNPIIIKSRDNLDLVSYITLPPTIKLNKALQPKYPLPLVLYVHGGPWSRDVWGYNAISQWLSDRGYAVLLVNYRGSIGFGKNFLNAGNLQWGKKMHDDLIDAVNWAVENKIANPKKIVIMGGSYGGYAALAGITLTPDIFAGAVDIVGPSNLLTLVNNFPSYWHAFLNVWKKRMGPWDTEEQKQALLQVSPLSHVEKITKPLLIAQGANDPRVTKVESSQIVETMKKRNIPVVYALYADEGHGFARPENRISFYALTEQFLAKILGGKCEPIGNDLNGANFILNGAIHNNSLEIEKVISQAVPKW